MGEWTGQRGQRSGRTHDGASAVVGDGRTHVQGDMGHKLRTAKRRTCGPGHASDETALSSTSDVRAGATDALVGRADTRGGAAVAVSHFPPPVPMDKG